MAKKTENFFDVPRSMAYDWDGERGGYNFIVEEENLNQLIYLYSNIDQINGGQKNNKK